MSRYIALLRGINVGGHVVRMEELRKVFSSLGFSGVETFIASGNVVFTAAEADACALERRIEAALQRAFGYAVDTFIRSTDELAAVARHQPFSPDPAASGGTVYVIFLMKAPGAAARRQITALSTDADTFAVKGREVYWCRRGKLLESTVSDRALGRALGGTATTRNRNTVLRLCARLQASR